MGRPAHVVIVHGSYGSPDENWFPWLANNLRTLGHTTSSPTFPSPDGQSLDSWLRKFESEIGPLTSNMVLVGHSLAPAFILSLLERAAGPVEGVFLVSGFLGPLGLEEFDSINETFTCREFNWDRVRSNAGAIHVYNSDDDPYVPIDKGRELAERLGVCLNVIEGAGHINAGAGFTEFPRLLADIEALVGRA